MVVKVREPHFKLKVLLPNWGEYLPWEKFFFFFSSVKSSKIVYI